VKRVYRVVIEVAEVYVVADDERDANDAAEEAVYNHDVGVDTWATRANDADPEWLDALPFGADKDDPEWTVKEWLAAGKEEDRVAALQATLPGVDP